MTNSERTTLTLGPLLYNWSPEKARDFYLRVADEVDVDRVYLGEVVCSKRQPFHEPYWAQAVERLERAGKQVVFSSLALVTTRREVRALSELADPEGEHVVELNDLTALEGWTGGAFRIGPYINVYNESSLRFFESLGATGATLPFELTAKSLAQIAASTSMEIEVQAFGRLPLAISARCYHARAYRLHKDNCRFVCADHSDGMVVKTLDGAPFLTVNGTQTQSLTCVNLLEDLAALAAMGIRTYRLSPQDIDMADVAATFRSVATGSLEARAGLAHLGACFPQFVFSNGYFHGLEGRVQTSAREAI